ncbi:MAG TPA: hypothetical protein VLF67_04810 [Candidatus Saccharimonas sp.]|nr:hypothetical protein [Candidatus Saccharimonas sp.]
MAELTAETVRTIIKEEVGSLRTEIQAEFADVRQELAGVHQELAGVHQDLTDVRQDLANGLETVLTTVQSFHDEDQDAHAAIEGRLRSHNERLARLERYNRLRT